MSAATSSQFCQNSNVSQDAIKIPKIPKFFDSSLSCFLPSLSIISFLFPHSLYPYYIPTCFFSLPWHKVRLQAPPLSCCMTMVGTSMHQPSTATPSYPPLLQSLLSLSMLSFSFCLCIYGPSSICLVWTAHLLDAFMVMSIFSPFLTTMPECD